MTALRTAPSPVVKRLTVGAGSVLTGLGVLMASSEVMNLHPAVSTVLGVAVAVVGALQAGLDHYVQSSVVSVEKVVEAVDGGEVRAGPANEFVEEGHTVRAHGVPLEGEAVGPEVRTAAAYAEHVRRGGIQSADTKAQAAYHDGTSFPEPPYRAN